MNSGKSLDFKLVQRICLLQQALDQATESIEHLKQQADHQGVLEFQLAQTEKYSNVQKKIITTLQQQLAKREQWQEETFTAMLLTARTLVEQQQLGLEALRMALLQGQTEVQDYLGDLSLRYQAGTNTPSEAISLALTSEVMVVRALTASLSNHLQTAQQHLQAVDQTLAHHQGYLDRLWHQAFEAPEGQLTPDHPNSGETPPEPIAQPITLPPEAPDLTTDHPAPPSTQTLITKLQAIEHTLQQQFQQQTRLRTRCQQLAAERDHYREALEQLQQDHNTPHQHTP